MWPLRWPLWPVAEQVNAEVRRLESDLRALTARLGDAERQCGNLREGIAERERAHSTDVRRLTEQATHQSFALSAHALFSAQCGARALGAGAAVCERKDRP